jgi:predicted nucleotidyltransferase
MDARSEDGTIRIKKLCYALRAALCLRYAMAVEEMPPTPFADVLAGTELEPDELAAIRDVLAQKEHALESDTVTPDARLAGLLSDRYDSLAVHLWRKRGMTGDVYDKLEQCFGDTVKGVKQCE